MCNLLPCVSCFLVSGLEQQASDLLQVSSRSKKNGSKVVLAFSSTPTMEYAACWRETKSSSTYGDKIKQHNIKMIHMSIPRATKSSLKHHIRVLCHRLARNAMC